MSSQIYKHMRIKYSKTLSSLFTSVSIVLLTAFCLLSSMSLDIYTFYALLKVVVPGCVCFWILGYAIGEILDKNVVGQNGEVYLSNKDKEAYEIPSMFSLTPDENIDDISNITENE